MGFITEKLVQWSRDVKLNVIGDYLAFTIVILGTLAVYIYGNLYIIGAFFPDNPLSTFFLRCLGTWIEVGILSHLILVLQRKGSIRNKVLAQPKISNGPSQCQSNYCSNCIAKDNLVNKRCDCKCHFTSTKTLAEQFMAEPFNDTGAWHLCASCETFVPPKTWHCQQCKICIFRRDHHCIFTMCCIGLENHLNFLGFMFYIMTGAFGSIICIYSYIVYHTDIVIWKFFFKTFFGAYFLFIDFNIFIFLSSVVMLTWICSTAFFWHYIFLAFKGATSSDRKGRQMNKVTLENFRNFLGPNAIFKILWPYHEPIHNPHLAIMDTNHKDRNNTKDL